MKPKLDMFKMRKYVVFLIILVVSMKLTGQKSLYFDGYVVTQKLDTIHGQILHKDNQVNPKTIELKNGNNLIKFELDEILYAEITGKAKYFRKKVKYSINAHVLGKITTNKEVIWKEDQELLEAINLGEEINLYKFVDENSKTHYFINNEKGELLNLYVLKYKRDGDIVTIPKYKTKLKRVLRNCPSIYKSIDESKFTHKSLQLIIKQYNECMSFKSIYVSEEAKNGLEIYLKGGISSTRRAWGEMGSVNFGGELNFDIVLPKNNRVWGLINGIGYRSYRLPVFQNVTSSMFKFDLIRYNIGVKRVVIRKDHLTTNVNIGIVNSILTKLPFKTYGRYRQGYFFGLENYYNNIGMEIRFEAKNIGISSGIIEKKEETILVLLSYRFYKNKNSR